VDGFGDHWLNHSQPDGGLRDDRLDDRFGNYQDRLSRRFNVFFDWLGFVFALMGAFMGGLRRRVFG
jgi:hypothetical protein